MELAEAEAMRLANDKQNKSAGSIHQMLQMMGNLVARAIRTSHLHRMVASIIG
jgi:hypothetical protein